MPCSRSRALCSRSAAAPTPGASGLATGTSPALPVRGTVRRPLWPARGRAGRAGRSAARHRGPLAPHRLRPKRHLDPHRFRRHHHRHHPRDRHRAAGPGQHRPRPHHQSLATRRPPHQDSHQAAHQHTQRQPIRGGFPSHPYAAEYRRRSWTPRRRRGWLRCRHQAPVHHQNATAPAPPPGTPSGRWLLPAACPDHGAPRGHGASGEERAEDGRVIVTAGARK